MRAARPRLGRLVALVLLAGASASAVAAASPTLDTVSAVVSDQQTRPGTAKAPAALGLGLALTVSPANGASYSAPVTDIRITLPAVRAHPADFPVCAAATIAEADSDSVCPAAARVGTGGLVASLWNPAVSSAPAQACNPAIDVWNAGGDRLAYFLTFGVGHVCGGLVDGSLAPWTGTLTRSGTMLVADIPLPPELSTDTGGTGLFTGLASLHLQFPARTVTVAGKAVAFLASVGCPSGQRPDTVTVRDTDGTSSQVARLPGSGAC